MHKTQHTSGATYPSVAAQQIDAFMQDDAVDRRSLRRALFAALAFHLGLFAITFPSFTKGEIAPPDKPKFTVIEVPRYQPPPPPEEIKIPKARARQVAIPDPTPHDPEPLSILEPANFEELPIGDLVIVLPKSVPEPQPEITYVVGDVHKPEKIAYPAPRYTETARKARITGIVILESTIDKQGNVVNVRVLKGLPMGLSEAAMNAVRQWRFKPATLLGEPVAVYFNLTVKFELQ